MKIFQVNSVTVTKQSETPLTFIIHALGIASSTGWTAPVLDGSGDPNPEDAIFEYNFEAKPPVGLALQILTPIAVTLVVTPQRSVDAVVVNARTNTITIHASEFLEATAPPRQLTTLALGEEGPFPITLRMGEEGLTTFAIGEESLPSFIRGEEGPTTFRMGEEGGSTLRLGEEGPITDPRLDDPADPIGGGFGGPFGGFR
jgi:hypothetical protein